jgi:hypothetical protein
MVPPPDQDWVARPMWAACKWRTALWFDRSLNKVTHCREFCATAGRAGSMVAPIHVCSYGTAEQVAEVLP